MRAPAPLLFALATTLCAVTAQQPAFRFVERAPQPEPAVGPAWPTSFADAQAAARQRGVLMLLYFTAKW